MYRVLTQLDAGLIVAAVLTLFISQSLFQPGLPTLADLPIHLYRTYEYGQAWAPGVIVPRWSPNLAFGYGYPLFIFAPPLPYWLGLGFYGIGFSLEMALRLLIILTILLYAIGMYLLAREMLGSVQAGLVAAVAYAFAPFALREALLYGGNVPQYLAIALFPWTLWAMARSARTYSWAWAVVAACFYAGVMLSHLFQAFVFTPVVGLFGLILLASQMSVVRGQRSVVSSQPPPHPQIPICYPLFAIRYPLSAIPLGLLLSAFFWLPAFTERVFTRAQAEIYLTKSPFFVRYPYWDELIAWIQPLDARAANPYAPLTLGPVPLALAALGLALVIRNWKLHSSFFLLFFALVAAGAAFMSLPASRIVWETVSILQVAEFPWRMLGLANLGLAFLAGAAILWAPVRRRWAATLICLVLQVWSSAPYLYPVIPFTEYGHISLASQADYERRSQSIGTTTLGEYLPQSVTKPPTTSPLVESFLAQQNPERLDRASLPAGATATLREQTAVKHVYQLETPTNFTLRLFQFDFPGWAAWLDDQPIPIKPEPESGLILVEIPAGQHTLVIQFGETTTRLIATGLTALTVMGLVVAGLWRRSAAASRPSFPETKSHLSLHSPATLIGILVIIAGALWLKPWLSPFFTLDSPPDQALPAQYHTRVDFANGIQLIAYDLDKKVIRAGQRLAVVLYWQTGAAPLKVNLQPFVHLDRLDNFTTVADATNYTPGDATTESVLPTFHWDNGRYVRDEHDLIIPPTTPPQAYALRIGLIDPDQDNRLIPLAAGAGDTAQLAVINVAPEPGQSLQLAQPLAVSFEAGRAPIQLTGFELDPVSAERLTFRLAWQTNQTPTTDYTVFAQLLDSENNLSASYDQPPLNGAYPTSTWLPDQVIIDPRFIPLNNVPAGKYRLIVGLYDPGTQQRLRTASGADFVELTQVTVGKP